MKTTAFLIVAALTAAILGVCGGAEWITPWRWWFDERMDSVIELRLLRVLTAFTVGGGLALAGMVFQAVLRNPLAEPYTLGLSGGAGVGAALAFVSGLRIFSVYTVPAAAFCGALVVLAVVLGISRGGGRGEESLLLSGVIAGTVASSILMYIVSTAHVDELAGLTWWMLGDLQAVDADLLVPFVGFCAIALAGLRYCAGDLNAVTLGAEPAFSFGVDRRRLMLLVIPIAALLAAGTIALCGIIGFCGLVVPHAVRRIYGCDHRRIVVKMFLAGGGFLVLCDLAGRVIWVERELPIGVATALIGGPVFLWLLNRRNRYAA